MIRTRLKAVILFFIIVLMYSCYSSNTNIYIQTAKMENYSIDVLKPANKNLSLSIYHLGFIASPYIKKETEVVEINGNTDEEYTSNYNNYDFENLLFSVKNIINDGPKYNINNDEAISVNLYSNGEVDWEKVEEVCNKLNIDGIIYIKYFSSIVKIFKTKSNEYSYSLTYSYSYFFTPQIKIEFLNPTNKEIEDICLISNTYRWNEKTNFNQEIEEFYNKFDQEISSYLKDMANNYVSKIAPSWKTEKRQYYSTGNRDFILAGRAVKENQWEKAKQIWELYKDASRRTYANYANYNLALASEIEGNLEEAHKFAAISGLNYNNYYAKEYAKILRKRIADKEIIKRQLND